MIREIVMENIKGQTKPQPLTGRDIIIGPNGSGKTTRLQSLGIALLGYVPGNGKLPAETYKLATGQEMTVGLKTDGFSFERTFTRSEKIGRDGSAAVTMSQDITVSPSRGEKKLTDKEGRIIAEVGNFPVMLDFNEFLTLSDAKRRDFIYSLGAIRSRAWDRPAVEKYLRDRLLTMELEVNNPDQSRIMSELIEHAMAQYPAGDDVQSGLQAMLDWARAKQTHWNAEKKNAEGAVKKLADMKNQLAETDRDIAQHKNDLESLQQQLTDVEAQLARDRERQRLVMQRLARIEELERLIAELQKRDVLAEVHELDLRVAELQAAITTTNDADAEMTSLNEQLQAALVRIEALSKEERATATALAQTQAEKGMLSRALARIEAMEQQRADGEKAVAICVIHPLIACPKDFSKAHEHFAQQIAALDKAEAEQQATLAGIQQAHREVDQKRGEAENRRSALFRTISQQAQANEGTRRAIATLESRRAGIANGQARVNDQIQMYREELGRLQNQPVEATAPIDILERRRDGLKEQIGTLKATLEEQERARITLGNLKASMIDCKTAAYYAQCSKDLVEALGAKGLQGELVKEILEPIRADVQANLRLIGVDREPFFATESDTGKEVFQFGWRSSFGDERNFDALSTGEQLLLLIAMLVTFLDWANPPLKVLAIDNIENLDKGNSRRVLDGLAGLNGKLDNVLLAGVSEVPADVAGWNVINLGLGEGEVRQSA